MTEDDVFREFLKSFDSPNDPDGEVRKIFEIPKCLCGTIY